MTASGRKRTLAGRYRCINATNSRTSAFGRSDSPARTCAESEFHSDCYRSFVGGLSYFVAGRAPAHARKLIPGLRFDLPEAIRRGLAGLRTSRAEAIRRGLAGLRTSRGSPFTNESHLDWVIKLASDGSNTTM